MKTEKELKEIIEGYLKANGINQKEIDNYKAEGIIKMLLKQALDERNTEVKQAINEIGGKYYSHSPTGDMLKELLQKLGLKN